MELHRYKFTRIPPIQRFCVCSDTVEFAQGLKAADLNGKCDPYCVVTCPLVDLRLWTSDWQIRVPSKKEYFEFKTRHINKTLDPVWHESVNADFFEYDHKLHVWTWFLSFYSYDSDITTLEIEVRDHDLLNQDDFLYSPSLVSSFSLLVSSSYLSQWFVYSKA